MRTRRMDRRKRAYVGLNRKRRRGSERDGASARSPLQRPPPNGPGHCHSRPIRRFVLVTNYAVANLPALIAFRIDKNALYCCE